MNELPLNFQSIGTQCYRKSWRARMAETVAPV
jgi:hypothetical protein